MDNKSVWDALSWQDRERFLQTQGFLRGWAAHTWRTLDRTIQAAFEVREKPSSATPGAVASSAGLVKNMERLKAERANAASRGFVILPSVDGPYCFDPVMDRVVGRKGSAEYRDAVSETSSWIRQSSCRE